MDFGMPYLMELDTLEEAARLCHELGLSFVEVNANFPACRPDKLDASALREMAARYGIYFTLHIEEECDPFTFNPAVREAWMQSVRRAIRLAREAGMSLINMHLPRGVYITLPEEKVFLYRRYRAEFHEAIRAFRVMVETEVGESGLRVCIENTSGWHPHEQEAIELLLESSAFGLTLDIGHCHGAGNADEAFFLAHRDRLCHMHGHDALGRKDHLPLGTGEIKLTARFALAEECGARVVLETKTIAALRTSVARLPMYLRNDEKS